MFCQSPPKFGPERIWLSRDFARTGPLLKTTGAHLVFHPSVEEMYPAGANTFVEVCSEMPKATVRKTRPHIHFGGVHGGGQTLQHRHPDKAFFGWKDAQHLLILRRMVETWAMGWNWWAPHCPGSRTAGQVFPEHLLNAPGAAGGQVLSQAVFLGQKLVAEGEQDGDRLVQAMKACLWPLARIDYVQAVDSETLEPVHTLKGHCAGRPWRCTWERLDLSTTLSRRDCDMTVEMLKGKIHRATVTQAELHYVGPSPWTWTCWRRQGILEYEKVQVVDIDNGSRFETYTIGEPGIGDDLPQRGGCPVRQCGDKVILMAYAQVTPQENPGGPPPCGGFVDEENRVTPGNQL